MVIYYHGTNEMNGLSILNDRLLMRTSAENSIYGVGDGHWQTKSGYVYLSTTIEKGMDFALSSIKKLVEQKIPYSTVYVFKIALQDDIELYPDMDELEIHGFVDDDSDLGWTAEESDALTDSISVKQGFNFGGASN
ncbi:hypothetical protein [Brevibacillus sp. NRS-1366]|uniref:hypothetical protein n=1 Tax=Brevibacillus sp. NRS-1366 TaxID=3233899 RepID=UPI003D1EAAE5